MRMKRKIESINEPHIWNARTMSTNGIRVTEFRDIVTRRFLIWDILLSMRSLYPRPMMKKIFLSAVHRKLALSVSFSLLKVDFPALVRENQLSAPRTTLTWLTIDMQQTSKRFLRVTSVLVATRSWVKIRLSALDTRYTILQ